MSAQAHRLPEVNTLRGSKPDASPLYQSSYLPLASSSPAPIIFRCFLGNLYIIILLTYPSQAWERQSSHRSRCYLYSPSRPHWIWAGQWAGVLGTEWADQRYQWAGPLHLRPQQPLHQWWAVARRALLHSIHSPLSVSTSSPYSILTLTISAGYTHQILSTTSMSKYCEAL